MRDTKIMAKTDFTLKLYLILLITSKFGTFG